MRVFITGIGGLVGSAVAEECLALKHDVTGIDSDRRGKWFGPGGSTRSLFTALHRAGAHVVDADLLEERWLPLLKGMELVVHCASQPSHDFSKTHVLEDSTVNYIGTVRLLEAFRDTCPKATFVFLSTNKVYGDDCNNFFYLPEGRRLMPPKPIAGGFDEVTLNMDGQLHTPFGVSKTAADLMVQEYRYCFGLKTYSLRCGCLTGAGSSAVELHGFLGYLVKCAVHGLRYTIYGYNGLQVRDNLAAPDLARAILACATKDTGETVYHMGGGPENSISVWEAIEYLKGKHGCAFAVDYDPKARQGDHQWWVSDTTKFQKAFDWKPEIGVYQVIDDMVAAERKRL